MSGYWPLIIDFTVIAVRASTRPPVENHQMTTEKCMFFILLARTATIPPLAATKHMRTNPKILAAWLT